MKRETVLTNMKRKSRLSSGTLILILIVLCAALSLARPEFISSRNLYNLLRSTSVTGLVSIGMTFVIITGGIDLSVGSVVGLSSVMCGVLLQEQGWSTILALAVRSRHA